MMKEIAELIGRLEKIKSLRPPNEGAIAARSYRCPLCHDRGVVLDGEIARVCHCVRQVHLEQRYQYANITPEINGCSFENFRIDYYEGVHREKAARALQGAKQFAEDYLHNRNPQGILFSGDVGAGKTYLAGAITNYLLKHNVQVLFLVVPDFLDEIRATYHKNFGESQEINDLALLKGARQVDVLILDDLGVHNYTPWTCNKLYSLLNYRLNYQLPVIITTNLALGEIEEFLGERTTSRIVEMCQTYRLTVDKDIRHIKNRDLLK